MLLDNQLFNKGFHPEHVQIDTAVKLSSPSA